MGKENPAKSFIHPFVTDSGANRFGHLSPLRLFVIIISSIFAAEVFAMLVVYVLRPIPYYLTTLIDAGIMVVLIFPVLYWFSLRPLIQQIEELQEAREQVNKMALFPALNPDPVLQVDGNGRIREANPAAIQLGLETQVGLFELIPDLSSIDLAGFIESGSVQHIYEARLGDQIFEWTIRGAPDLGLAFLYGQDVTERKRSEDAIRLLSSVVEQTADTVVVTSCTGGIEYVNPAFEVLTGYRKEEVFGQSPRFLKSGLHDKQFYQELWDTVLGGQVFQSEISSRKKNGEIFHEVKTITPLRNAQGDITRFVATGKDITERKQAEEKLRSAYDDLELRVQERTEELKLANSDLADEINVRRQAEETLQMVNEKLQIQTIELEMQADELKAQKQRLVIANELLLVSQEQLSRAQEIAHLGSWELDLLTNQLTWSDEVYRIFGLQPQEFDATYEAFLEAVHPEDRAAVDEAYSGSIRDGRDLYEIEHRVVKRPNGEIRIVHEKCEHFRDETGRIIRSVGMVHDITERKKAEDALRLAHAELELRVHERTEELAAANRELSNEIADRREIERQLRIQTAAMEAAANGIMITDPKGRILWTNPAVSQISGYSDRDLIGHSTRLFSSGRHDQAFYQQMWETIQSGSVWQGETTNRRKDGNLYIEEQTITPVRNEDGKLSHFIAIKQDITERKLMYSQLEASNRELQILTAAEREQRFLAEGLVESSMVLNMSLELHAVLDHIIEQTRRTIPYLVADIVLIESGVANVVRQWGFEGRSESMTIFENDNLKLEGFPTWGRICKAKSTVLIPDTQRAREWDSYFGMQWIRSYLGAPLIYGDQVIGIINLISDQADAFHEEMAKNLRAFAAPAAVAIQNARLYEAEQQNRKVAETLSAASVDLVQTLDIQVVMETILDYVQFALPSDVAFVILSEGEERYRIRAARAGGGRHTLRGSLLDQTIDLLNEPLLRSYFTIIGSTYIPDSREVADWHPPFELEFLNCWLGIPLESVGKMLGMVVIAHAAPNSFTRNQIQLMEAVVKQAVVALQNAWLFEQVRSGRERLQQLSRHLVEIQENERKYIARELHDETSQSLTSLKIGLQVIEQKAAGRRQILEQVANLKSLADETLEGVHRLAVNLRPASLDHLGLVDALTGLVESIKQRSGITAHFKTMGAVQATFLTEEMETSMYRIVQESLTNVLRHAQASHVDIILEWQADKVVVIIEDNGIGIDLQKARESGHLGLIGMQERAEMLGGKLVVDSAPQVGTTLVVEIPYADSNTFSR